MHGRQRLGLRGVEGPPTALHRDRDGTGDTGPLNRPGRFEAAESSPKIRRELLDDGPRPTTARRQSGALRRIAERVEESRQEGQQLVGERHVRKGLAGSVAAARQLVTVSAKRALGQPLHEHRRPGGGVQPQGRPRCRGRTVAGIVVVELGKRHVRAALAGGLISRSVTTTASGGGSGPRAAAGTHRP